MPIPSIDEQLDRLSKGRVFSKMNLYQGYHKIPIQPGHKYRTAFLYYYGTFEYCVMPLGLINAPATFQHLMNSCFYDKLDKFMTIYLDDPLIYSRSKAEHEVYLFCVFDHLCEDTLFVKCKKCEIRKDLVKYLGYIIGQGHKHMDPSKVQAITKWPAPICT